MRARYGGANTSAEDVPDCPLQNREEVLRHLRAWLCRATETQPWSSTTVHLLQAGGRRGVPTGSKGPREPRFACA